VLIIFFYFYILFEAASIPLILLIGLFSSSSRSLLALYKLIGYTLLGSILVFISVIIIYSSSGSFDLNMLDTSKLSNTTQIIIGLLLFFVFSIKIPLVPVHLWLPEAHVEASTGVSVLLAGILLKIGGYGLIIFVLPLFPAMIIATYPLIWTICIFSIFY